MLRKVFHHIYTAPFALLALGVGVYQANRQRLRVALAKPKSRLLIRGLVIVTFGAWLLIWLLAGSRESNRLDRFLQETLPWLQGRQAD